ncbi:uncharacterized protein FOMMEDRAFT_19884 [Fomitiporia mediterranea MF3/22]|uniref:uncharacterized protein n=1 Tax=Fomitiporia mediterranea (strain MF3/22) TaxID=694068 RepID=UPI0004408A41|nr:uncharacterized protein FOMMEDRAFT_19884 [Fomitiporia mediterranea MF3/22]EJD02570.1 hypothetical protein FOMMEDRAFT_19884 [Fomitiporia mediterranea MF3/22]
MFVFQSLALVCSLLGASTVVTAQTGLAAKKFLNLPLGAVKPTGWLHNQLNVQMTGLWGHEHEFYHYVSQTDWLGGDSYYSNLEEAGSYWFNAMVPAAVLIDSAEVQNQTQYFLDFVLDNQDDSGWLGPEVFDSSKPRFLWGRYPYLFGAMQMVENNATLADRVVPALYKFVTLANTMLKNGQGLEDWTKTRWEDFVMALQWLYDFYPSGNEDMLIETMQLLKANGDPWEDVFKQEFFPQTAVEHLQNPFPVLTWHGVNMAEGLKALPSTYRFTHNQSDLDRASEGWDLLFQYHGRPSGIFAADEYLAGLGAIRGTELCLVVETMFSGSYLYQVIGDLKYADRVERIAYNALPATLTGDMWSRQYLQEQNQIAAQNMNPNPFPNDGPYSNVFGLEPNYPCCTVNHGQGFPKFIANSFVKTPDNASLVQVYFGPVNARTVLAGDNSVSASVDTTYPFSDIVSVSVSADKAFTYLVRIPSWVSGATISLNGGDAKGIEADSSGLASVDLPAGNSKFMLNLPSEITIENRPNNSIAVHRGPLNYAFDIPRNQTIIAQNADEPRAIDVQMEATAAWQYAIDPKTLKFNAGTPEGGTLPSPVFDSGLPPFSMSVTACPIEWSVAGDTFASDPPQNVTCTGNATTITLWPLGATKLRISEFPTFDSSK